MSANNQILIKEHKGRFYVFDDINAESWDEVNTLSIKEAVGVFDNRDDAYNCAVQIERESRHEIEYGVQFNRLCKDDAEVKIIE